MSWPAAHENDIKFCHAIAFSASHDHVLLCLALLRATAEQLVLVTLEAQRPGFAHQDLARGPYLLQRACRQGGGGVGARVGGGGAQ